MRSGSYAMTFDLGDLEVLETRPHDAFLAEHQVFATSSADTAALFSGSYMPI